MIYICITRLIVAWLLFSYVTACFMFMWDALVSPYLWFPNLDQFFFLDLILYTRLVNLFFLPIKLETRSRVQWWAMLMFGSAMEVDILMLTQVKSLKTCMAQNLKLWIFVWPVCYLYCFSHIIFFFFSGYTHIIQMYT